MVIFKNLTNKVKQIQLKKNVSEKTNCENHKNLFRICLIGKFLFNLIQFNFIFR